MRGDGAEGGRNTCGTWDKVGGGRVEGAKEKSASALANCWVGIGGGLVGGGEPSLDSAATEVVVLRVTGLGTVVEALDFFGGISEYA